MAKGELYLVGIGLSEGQVSLEAIEALKRADVIYVEGYTSAFPTRVSDYVSRLIGRDVHEVDRRVLEEESGGVVLKNALMGMRVALVAVGDPMMATTHSALLSTASRLGVRVRVINGISIICASMGQAGLSIYKLGPVATVTYPRMGVLSTRAYEVLSENLKRGLHTLLLLDIRDGGFMDFEDALAVLKDAESRVGGGLLSSGLLGIFESRVGWPDQSIAVSRLDKPPKLREPGVIIVPGLLNPVEEEYLVNVLGADEGLVKGHVEVVRRLANQP